MHSLKNTCNLLKYNTMHDRNTDTQHVPNTAGISK